MGRITIDRGVQMETDENNEETQLITMDKKELLNLFKEDTWQNSVYFLRFIYILVLNPCDARVSYKIYVKCTKFNRYNFSTVKKKSYI